MNIIFIGPQGSGKGTQARIIAEKLGYFYLEAGKFFRDIAKTNPEIDEIVNKKGLLLPDEQTFELISKYLLEKSPELDNIIFDGFPRTVNQNALLENWLKEKGKKLDLAILLNISDEESVKRLSARRTCEVCGTVYNLITNPPKVEGKCDCGGDLVQREDDQPEAIKKRLLAYHEITTPLAEIYEKEGILKEINGEQPIETITGEILAVIQK